jgi:polyhydroxybutyrate depolymerase
MNAASESHGTQVPGPTHLRRLPGLLGLAAAGALVLAACSGASTTPPTSTSSPGSTPSTTAAITAAGCSRAPAGSTTLTPTVGGHLRTVIVHVPAGYSGTRKLPLVINLHGSGSTAAEQEGFTAMDATADAGGFVVAYPQALIPEGSGFDWNVPGVPLVGGRPVPAGAADDVAFLTALPGLLERTYCIDPARVYATGFSGGARTASQLACDSSTVFAAVAPVSGLRLPSPCPTGRPVAVLSFHGTADPVDPYRGHGQPYWTYSVPQAAQKWAAEDGCSATPATSAPAPKVTLSTYSGCRDGAVVELYTIAGEGHEWPGGPHLPRAITSFLGPQTSAIDADSVMWSFFQAHPLP